MGSEAAAFSKRREAIRVGRRALKDIPQGPGIAELKGKPKTYAADAPGKPEFQLTRTDLLDTRNITEGTRDLVSKELAGGKHKLIDDNLANIGISPKTGKPEVFDFGSFSTAEYTEGTLK